MSFTYTPCIPMQIKPNKSPLRKSFPALLLGEIGHLSSPGRSCLGRLILTLGSYGWGGQLASRVPPPHSKSQLRLFLHICRFNQPLMKNSVFNLQLAICSSERSIGNVKIQFSILVCWICRWAPTKWRAACIYWKIFSISGLARFKPCFSKMYVVFRWLQKIQVSNWVLRAKS